MGGAHGFAFAAAQAIFDRVGNGADVRLLHDQRLVPHEAKTGGIGLAQVGVFEQLAFVETTLGIDARFVVGKRLELLLTQILELGDANPVFSRNHTIQRPRQRHDAVHRLMCGFEHVVVVAVDWQIGVHIAVACMHVQSRPNPAFENALMHSVKLLAQ